MGSDCIAFLFAYKDLVTLPLSITSTKSLSNYLTNKKKTNACSVEADFQEGAEGLLLLFLLLKVAYI
jgi:hypothetical protein